MTLPVSITTEIQKLTPSAVIELFVLDATSLGGDVLRFHAGTNQLHGNVVWQGQTYVRFPIMVSGFEMNGQGQFPRPKLQVSNALSAITTLLLAYDDLLGAKLTRKRTLAKFLDAVNFDGGVNPDADSTAEFADDVYFVDRKSSEDRDIVEFELASALDVVGVKLPRRQVIQNVCIWKYRGAECGYTGAPVFDEGDSPKTTATTTAGQTLLDTYAAMVSAKATYDAAVSALSAAAYAKGEACEYVLQSSAYHMDTGSEFPTQPWDFAAPKTFFYTFSQWGRVILSSAYYADSAVSLGLVYRQGALQQTIDARNNANSRLDFYSIEVWGPGAGCTAATTSYTAAVSARDSALTAYNTAVANYNAALAALPLTDPLYTSDVCGKRLASCKVRFGDKAPLPFGSFPGAGLIR